MGVISLAAGAMGYFIKRAGLLERLLLISAAFLLIKPGFLTDVLGFVLLGAVFISQKYLL
ncbi:MAG: FxsA family protein [candidate division NC10 bacterium]|nr:FxsA family protein [candidate division NC10 bacterium]